MIYLHWDGVRCGHIIVDAKGPRIPAPGIAEVACDRVDLLERLIDNLYADQGERDAAPLGVHPVCVSTSHLVAAVAALTRVQAELPRMGFDAPDVHAYSDTRRRVLTVLRELPPRPART